MASIEQELKQSNFASEQVKAHLNILFTANWLHNKMASFMKPYKLTPEQFNVLRILRGKHPQSMCQKDILARMIARQSNITLIINKLKGKQFIEVNRSEVDKREYVISIAAKGLELLKQIDLALEEQQPSSGKLSESESFHLNALLDKLRED